MNPSCIAGTLLASKHNPNVNFLELRAACQEMNNLCKAKQTVYWRGGVGCRWGVAGLRGRAWAEGHQSCFCQKTQSHGVCFLPPLIQLQVELPIFPGKSVRAFQPKHSRQARQMFAPCSSQLALFVFFGMWGCKGHTQAQPGTLSLSLLYKWSTRGNLDVDSGIPLAADGSVAGLFWWDLSQ